MIQNFPEEKTSPDVFTDELYQYLKKQMIPTLSKLFDRMGENCQFIQYIPDSQTRQWQYKKTNKRKNYNLISLMATDAKFL